MVIKLNWDRVKKLHAELVADGWKDSDKLIFIVIEKGGKPKKAVVPFAEFFKFLWYLIDNDDHDILTFVIQDSDGRIIYRHRQVVGNEEVPNGGNADIISRWATFTDEEKTTYITILVAQIDSYER